MPQVKQLPEPVRKVFGMERFSDNYIKALRIIQRDWCGRLVYHELCPHSKIAGCKGCIPELTEISEKVRQDVLAKRGNASAFLTTELRFVATAKIEDARAAHHEEVAEELEGHTTDSASNFAMQVLEELRAAA